MHGYGALVVPVRTAAGEARVLRVRWPHDEQEHEHLGLQAWAGNGTVLMYRADPARAAMLLERLHQRDLSSVDDDLEACEIIAGFYERLHVPALPQLRHAVVVHRPLDEQPRCAAGQRADPAPARRAGRSASAVPSSADPATDARMIHGDLHYENVLAADREPWLVIDPKPMAGDPHYEVAPLLWNRWDEMASTGQLRDHCPAAVLHGRRHRRLDEDRARDWVVVRMIHNAMWCIEDNPDGFDAEDRDYLTMCVSLAKAVQD